MYHSIIIVGDLKYDPQLRYTPDGIAITELAINVISNNQLLTFYAIVRGKSGEIIASKLICGQKIMVEGQLYVDPKTGGPRILEIEGEFVAKYYVNAQKVIPFELNDTLLGLNAETEENNINPNITVTLRHNDWLVIQKLIRYSCAFKSERKREWAERINQVINSHIDPVLPFNNISPNSKPAPISMPKLTNYTFCSTWKTQVYTSEKQDDGGFYWKYVGETPGKVSIQGDSGLYLEPEGISGEAIFIWMEELTDKSNVRGLRLGDINASWNHQKISEHAIASLNVFNNLQHLILNKPVFDEVSFKSLAGYVNLTYLSIQHPTRIIMQDGRAFHSNHISNDEFQHLGNLVNLEALEINLILHTEPLDKVWEYLQTLKKLTKLALLGCKLQNCPYNLHKISKLVNLDLSGNMLTTESLSYLSRLESLRFLSLRRNTIKKGVLALVSRKMRPQKREFLVC